MAREFLIPTGRAPVTPGEVLREEYLEPFDMTIDAFAKHIRISRNRVSEIVNGRRGVTPDTAMRFARALGTTTQFWLNLQLRCDLYGALHDADAKDLAKIRLLTPPTAA